MPIGLKGFQKGKLNPAWIGGKKKYICKFCGKEFFRWKKISDPHTYCSNKCANSCPIRRGKIANGHKGKFEKLANNWKGDDVGYTGLHKWVARHLGRPTQCAHCGKDGLTGKKIQWANKSGEYKRDLSDWIRLCALCHKKYDLKKIWKK